MSGAKTRCREPGGRGLTPFVFTWELNAGQRHIRIGSANPAVRTRKHEVVSCSVADPFPNIRRSNCSREARLEAQAANLPLGAQKDALLKKIEQLETASHINKWLSSPGLQPPA